jgi:PAS domain S-box-containing protein
MEFPGSNDSDQRYRELLEASPAPINLFDADGDIIWGNDAVVELLGLTSREELVDRSIFEFIDPEDRETAKAELAEVVGEGTATGPTAMDLHRADGETRHIRVATAPGRFDGDPIGQAVVVDVTGLKQAQADLEAERQFIDHALDTMQDVFFVMTPGGYLERWNDALLDVSGYTESEVAAMRVEGFFREADSTQLAAAIVTTFAEGDAVLEATLVTTRGREIPYEFRMRRLTRDGDVVGLVGIGRDISSRVARRQHLKAVDRLLQHHLRNQVTVIHGEAGTLRDDEGVDVSAVADRIESASERLLSMFDDHHHIVELLTEREDVGAIDVVAVVESAVTSARTSYPDADITADLPEQAAARAVPVVRDAVEELIENGIKHNDDPVPAVHLDVRTVQGMVRIRVTDTGPAIPEMEYEPLMDEASLTPTHHSTGLGLWLVHWVAERSGGTVDFKQNAPGGNTVTLELPGANL